MSKKKKKPAPIVDWVCDDSAAYPFPVKLKKDPVKEAEIMEEAFRLTKELEEKRQRQKDRNNE